MARKGSENLKPVRSKDEAKSRGRKGGLASGTARREKKSLRQRLELLLKAQDQESGKENADAITAALIAKALAGDVKAYEVIRDTIGEKPTDKMDANISGGLEIAWKS